MKEGQLVNNNKILNTQQQNELFKILKNRFEKYMERHNNASWDKLEIKLHSVPDKLCSLYEMELTGGEPDIVAYDEEAEEYLLTVRQKLRKAEEMFAMTLKL